MPNCRQHFFSLQLLVQKLKKVTSILLLDFVDNQQLSFEVYYFKDTVSGKHKWELIISAAVYLKGLVGKWKVENVWKQKEIKQKVTQLKKKKEWKQYICNTLVKFVSIELDLATRVIINIRLWNRIWPTKVYTSNMEGEEEKLVEK